jgi:hypothetical protein
MIEPLIPSRSPLEQLVFLFSEGAKITKVSETPVAGNGLPYCYVEVTGITGTQYVVYAYEKEAAELHEMAVKIMNKK